MIFQLVLYLLVVFHVLFELLEMFTQTLELYFSETSNYSDLILYTSMIGYFVLNSVNPDFDYMPEIRALIVIFAW